MNTKGQAHEASLVVRTTLETYPEVMLHYGNKVVFIFPCKEILFDTELNDSRLTNLVESSKAAQSSGCSVSSVGCCYPHPGKNQEQNLEMKDVKSSYIYQKERTCK